MTQEKQETRAEEVARIRSYLAHQATRRTPEQLVEALREAHLQLLIATAAISATRDTTGIWTCLAREVTFSEAVTRASSHKTAS